MDRNLDRVGGVWIFNLCASTVLILTKQRSLLLWLLGTKGWCRRSED